MRRQAMHPLSVISKALLSQTAPDGPSGMTSFLLPMVLIIGVFYLLVLRPQTKQQRQHQTFVQGLKKGDEVVTQGGIIGRIFLVEDRAITIDVGGGVKLRVLKANIAGAWVEKPAA